MTFIWATRGRTWGFRFLRDGGHEDPRVEYLRAFAHVDVDAPQAFRRIGGTVALRFLDPEQRQDSAGRTIPHEFIVYAPLALQLDSAEGAVAEMWPKVSAEFAEIWNAPTPSSLR